MPQKGHNHLICVEMGGYWLVIKIAIFYLQYKY